MSEKKKLSTFGKVWIWVCVATFVLSILCVFMAWILPEIVYYLTHEHDLYYCYSGNELICSVAYYPTAMSYAMNYGGAYIAIVFAVLAGVNLVMGIIALIRRGVQKSKEQQNNAPVLPTFSINGEEQVLVERHFNSIVPFILFLAALVGIILGIDMLRWYYTRDTGIGYLVGSVLVAVIGVLILLYGKIHLYVTNKRVFVKAPFASRLSLPLNRIAAVATGLFHFLRITTSAGILGQINLIFVPKYMEVYDTVNALLNEKQ